MRLHADVPVGFCDVRSIRVGFGNAVRVNRWVRRRWTLAVLGEKTGLTPGYISSVERGQRNPTLDAITQLADAFGLHAWELVREGEWEAGRLPEVPRDVEEEGGQEPGVGG